MFGANGESKATSYGVQTKDIKISLHLLVLRVKGSVCFRRSRRDAIH